jgi:transposase InsO family protein
MLQPPELVPVRRGFGRQRERRLREWGLRERIVELCRWSEALGWSQSGIADLLNAAPRTLRRWRHGLEAGRRVRALGRPAPRSPLAARQEVLELLDELGPGVGLPTLRGCFPGLLRAELDDLLRRYRCVWRRRHQGVLHVLEWTVPGSVWAVDFAEAPAAIGGAYPHLLAVRDLASGRQLLWLPTPAETAAEVVNALASLFVLYGPPLVLKSDNGSAFIAEATQALLAGAAVIPLFSPAYTPQYNGSVEAGIGSLKTRTERHAARNGHPGDWTGDDAAAAQAEANALAHPHGERGPTPDAAWSSRHRLTAADRALFQAAVTRLRDEESARAGLATEGSPNSTAERRAARVAIRRALVERGYLLFSRRRIPLPIPRRKAARLT